MEEIEGSQIERLSSVDKLIAFNTKFQIMILEEIHCV